MKTHANPQLPLSVRNRLRGAADVYLATSLERTSATPNQIRPLASWLATYAPKTPAFHRGRFPSEFRLMRQERRIMPAIEFSREFCWCASTLVCYASALVPMLRDISTIEYASTAVSYDDALGLLDRFDEHHGYSLWSLEMRFALLQRGRGLDEQKALLNKIRTKEVNSSVQFLSFFISQRNEDTTNSLQFPRFLVENISQWVDDPTFKAYALFRLANRWTPTPATITAILRCENMSPILDLYQTFVRIVARLASENPVADPRITEPIKWVLESTGDPRLEKALFLVGSQEGGLNSVPRQPTNIFDLWLNREQDHRPALVTETLAANDLEALECASRLQEGISEGSYRSSANLALSTLKGLHGVSSRQAGFEEDYLNLLRFSANFPSLGFAKQLAALTEDSMSPAPMISRQALQEAFVLSPFLCASASRGLADEQVATLQATISSGSGVMTLWESFNYFRAGAAVPQSLPAAIENHMAADARLERLFRERNWDKIIDFEIPAAVSPNWWLRRFRRFRCAAFLERGEPVKAAQIVVDGYLGDPHSLRMLPVRRCFEFYDRVMRRDLAGDLATPILIDLFSRFHEERASLVRAAYEDFLTAHGLTRPSELINIAQLLPLARLVYYLSQICTPTNMQLSIVFDSSKALEDERASVCSLLQSLDPTHASEYDSEIQEIARRQTIHKGLRDIERSKIWIDAEALKRWADRQLRDNFQRYQALRAAGISEKSQELRSKDISAPHSMTEQKLVDLPVDEAADLLHNMLSLLVARCFLDPQHGLDCYLSLRIRHGAFSGQMRAPLEDERVITLRKGESSREYTENEHWLQRLERQDWQMARDVDACLREFSAEFDEIIDGFTKETVQIRSDRKPNGLFAPTLNPLDTYLISEDIHADTSFEAFVNMGFTAFWESVETSLIAVRANLDDVQRRRIDDLFIKLIERLQPITNGYHVVDLNNAIRSAQTRVGQALEVAEDWFRQPQPLSPRTVPFETLVDIGLQSVQKSHPTFQPHIAYRTSDHPQFVQITTFSDIFFIIFGNIWEHSGLTQPSVIIAAEAPGAALEITIRNEVAHSTRNQSSIERVQRIREAIDKGAFHGAVNTEGGTGLMKIRNIIGKGTSSMSRVEFGFDGAQWFEVRIEIPIKTLISGA
jgi:hypothetical protein